MGSTPMAFKQFLSTARPLPATALTVSYSRIVAIAKATCRHLPIINQMKTTQNSLKHSSERP